MLKDRLNQDIKSAMLAGEKVKVDILRNLKAAILNEEVALGVREAGLDDSQIEKVFAREAKKRIESAQLYVDGGRQDKADIELQEKEVIESYLPKQLSDDELTKVVDEVIAKVGGQANMGQVIGQVRGRIGVSADGSRIASIVKARLN